MTRATPPYHLHQEQFIARDLGETFSFFEDASNLQAITPTSLDFRIVTPLPIEMATGTLIDYQLKLCRIPFRWQTRITDYTPPRCFVDEQISGPYQLWRHRHEFQAVEGGTLMTDDIDYAIGWGPLGKVAHAAFVQRMLRNIFAYRRERIEVLIGGRT